jgi:ribosomal protein L34E
MHCSSCNLEKDNYARIRVEVLDKKTREVIEVMYGEIICVECLKKRYKERIKIRVYV